MKTPEQIEQQRKNYNSWLGETTIAKRNARILFNTNDDQKIDNIMVAEFNEDTEIWRKKEFRSKNSPSEFPYYLYDYFMSDIGNCVSNWDNLPLYAVIMQLLYTDEFINYKLLRQFIGEELWKIKEFRDDLIIFGESMDKTFPFAS